MTVQPAALSSQQTQLFALSTLVQLVKRARHAETVEELGFIVVNETHALVPYRQAVLWRAGETTSGDIAAISATPVVEANSPFTQWLRRALPALMQPKSDALAPANAGTSPRAVTARDLAGEHVDELGEEWAEWLPANGLLVPMAKGAGRPLGALLLVRDEPWTDGEILLLRELTDGYTYAFAEWLTRRRRPSFAALKRLDTRVRIAVALVIAAVLCIPVSLTALAPAEVVALRPAVVRAPLDGVVDHFVVQPNEEVKEGQIILELDPRAIENRLDIARKAYAVAEAEYRQAAQMALSDDKSRAQLAALRGRVEQRFAEFDYTQSLLDRVHVVAPRSGIAVYDDPNDWIGKPVSIGERILEIADPANVEIEVWLPVADSVTLAQGAHINFFFRRTSLCPRRCGRRAMKPRCRRAGCLAIG